MRAWALVLVLASLCGCNDQPQAIGVSGTVTFQGKPLDQGSIEFVPLDPAHLMSGAQIAEGKYQVPPEKGLSEGRYVVRLWSSEGGTVVPDAAPGESTITAKERIPPSFNVDSTHEVEVKAGAENKFDFNIP